MRFEIVSPKRFGEGAGQHGVCSMPTMPTLSNVWCDFVLCLWGFTPTDCATTQNIRYETLLVILEVRYMSAVTAAIYIVHTFVVTIFYFFEFN